MITESILQLIDQGRDNKNHGFSMGLPKLESMIDGVTQSTYTVVQSDSGSGKTSFVLYSYVYRPLMEHLYDNNFRVLYYALEMKAEMVYLKLLGMYIFEKYGVQLSLKEILSRKKGYILCDEYYNIVRECIPWLERVEEIVHIIDKGLTADRLYSSAMEDLEKVGHFETVDNQKKYFPDNPDLLHELVIDHLGLIRTSNGRNKKEEMDLASTYLVSLRNRTGISSVVIMQTNRNAKSMDRRKENLLVGRLEDSKNSGNMVEDAEIVLSLFNPHREQLNTHRGYSVKDLQNVLRTISVLKSRYGESDVEIGLAFYGNITYFKELPLPDQISDYSRYETPDWIIGREPAKTDKEFIRKYTFNL